MTAPDTMAAANPPPQAYDDEAHHLRRPPHSLEAEQSLLGGLLIDNAAYAKVVDQIAAGDFYHHAHKLIFGAIAQLIAERKPADVVTVFEQLGDLAEEAGGLKYINAVAQGVPSAASVPRYAEIIVERAARRAVIAAATITIEQAFSTEGTAAQLVDEAKGAFNKIAEQRKLASASRIPLLRPSELHAHATSTQWLIKHVIPADSVGMIFGASQAFKSFVAIDAACHVVHGMPWLGKRTRKGPVVYIAAEGGAGIWKRVQAWHKARGIPFNDDVDFFVIPMAVELRAEAWRVVEAVQALGITPAMVVVDTVSQTYTGEENSASDMAAYLRELGNRFRALWHCAVALLHHTGHNATERPRGSSAILANLDWAHGVFRDEKEMMATVTNPKQKDVEPFADKTFSLTVQTIGTDEDGDKVTSLVARHLTDVEAVQEAMEAEAKAGRGGHHTLFLSLLQNGSKEADMRKAFYEQCGLEDNDSKKRTYYRVKKWAVAQGFVEFVEGHILTLKGKV